MYNTSNQLSKFRTNKWVEINGDLREKYSTNRQIDTCILAKRTITITGVEKPLLPRSPARTPNHILRSRQNDEKNKGVIFKSCAPFTDCMSEINLLK